MEARLMKAELAASQVRVQELIDAEVVRLQKALGPCFRVRLSNGWTGCNRVEFSAEVSSERDHPEPIDDDEPQKPRLTLVTPE